MPLTALPLSETLSNQKQNLSSNCVRGLKPPNSNNQHPDKISNIKLSGYLDLELLWILVLGG
jgi:hypothetical protein